MISKSAILLVLAVSVILAACSTPSKPKNQQEISTSFGANKSVVYAAPSLPFEKPMFLAVGQHVKYGVVDKDGQKSIAKYSVVGRDGEIWTLESYSLTAGNETWTQLKVAGLDKAIVTRNSDDINIISARTKTNDDAPAEVEGVVLSLTKGVYKDALVHWTQKTTPLGQNEEVTVPAGTFLGCVKASTNLHVFGSWITATGFYHPDVPISGLVKSVSSNGIEMSLLDFGVSGAKASF